MAQDYKRPRELVRERPTPMFGYNSAEGYWDIPFPDFTFYGHEHSWLTGAATPQPARPKPQPSPESLQPSMLVSSPRKVLALAAWAQQQIFGRHTNAASLTVLLDV